MLDLATSKGGNGWALKRVFNIVGDKSTGKTLIAIEGFANLKRSFPKANKMRYAEAESAFDDSYAEVLGFPKEVTRPVEKDGGPKLLSTIEEFREDLYKFLKQDDKPGLYILDSLDALSDDAEMKKFTKSMNKKPKAEGEDEEKEAGSYGVKKAKLLSEMFRELVREIGNSNCALGIISQIRDRIGVQFGETKTRSGGHALDFYASQVVWLHEVGKIKDDAMGVTRATGINVLAKVKKCKVGFPFREAEFGVIFGYGIDDEISMIDWMKSIQAIDKDTVKMLKGEIVTARLRKDYRTLQEKSDQLKVDVRSLWNEIETKLAPPIRKYRD